MQMEQKMAGKKRSRSEYYNEGTGMIAAYVYSKIGMHICLSRSKRNDLISTQAQIPWKLHQ
jgi:hypothetical protein